jgi:hypothetical protein
MLFELLSLETLPSTLAVVAIIIFILGKYKSSVCYENTTCNSILGESDKIAIVSLVFATVLVMLICCGFITVSGSMGSGMYGGGYGGYF